MNDEALVAGAPDGAALGTDAEKAKARNAAPRGAACKWTDEEIDTLKDIVERYSSACCDVIECVV